MWQYRAAMVRVIDGDTLVLHIDTGFSVRTEQHIRLVDVSAPELDEPGGVECAQLVEAWCQNAAGRTTSRWPLMVETKPGTRVDAEEARTFTRYLGRVWPFGLGAPSLNADVDSFIRMHGWGTGR